MKSQESLKFEQIKRKALEELRSGIWPYGTDGAFAPDLKALWMPRCETIHIESLELKKIRTYGSW
jgi:hypothetical protein